MNDLSINMFLKKFLTFSMFSFLYFIDLNYCQTYNNQYEIGFGIADITGPAAEINMMGYAKTTQDTEGIHTRLYSRAVIIVDPISKKRVVFVTAEICSLTDIAKILVIKQLSQLYGSETYKLENVMLTASHTHSGPGGYFQYLLYVITSDGYQPQSLRAIVKGIVLSIIRAHNNLKPGKISYSEDELLNANINRSPTAYNSNPKYERDSYLYDTEKLMQMIKFEDLNGLPLGILNWFPVHCTSMNNTNRLISSDNKGYASKRFEKDFIKNNFKLNDQKFVAIFAQSNEGDSSPNTMGAKCQNSGLPCDIYTSTCPKQDLCIASGPGKDMFESTKIIGEMQYQKARKLFTSSSSQESIVGSINYIYQNLNMSNHFFKLENGTILQTCTAALGYSFAAGTTDGEGAAFFEQGTTSNQESKFWNQLRNFIVPLTQKQIDCHQPKALLIPVGEMKFPYLWSGDIVPTQIIEIGNIIIVGVPAEFTTMAGRRIKADIEKIYKKYHKNVHVILSGLANSYTNYVTTYEEYQVQRYEGGSTLFGPRTLEAYQAQYRYLAENLIIQNYSIPSGPELPNILSEQITWKPGVIFDSASGKSFGKVLLNTKSQYYRGDTVKVIFIGANPRNNLHLEGTFLQILYRQNPTLQWSVYATDADWSTKFIWERTNIFLGSSRVTILWDIPEDAPIGEYLIRYSGDAKTLFRTRSFESFVGKSRPFYVI